MQTWRLLRALGCVSRTQSGQPENNPSSSPRLKACLMTLLLDSVPIPNFGLAPHNCTNITTYPVPPGPPQPGLSLPRSSQQGRAEEAPLPEAVSGTQRQVWGQTLRLLDAPYFTPNAASQQAAPQGLPGTPTCKVCPQSLERPGRSSEGLWGPAASIPSSSSPTQPRLPIVLSALSAPAPAEA